MGDIQCASVSVYVIGMSVSMKGMRFKVNKVSKISIKQRLKNNRPNVKVYKMRLSDYFCAFDEMTKDSYFTKIYREEIFTALQNMEHSFDHQNREIGKWFLGEAIEEIYCIADDYSKEKLFYRILIEPFVKLEKHNRKEAMK